MAHKRILMVYTGGTIGMMESPVDGTLRPVALDHIRQLLPELSRMPHELEYYSFQSPIDSSNMLPEIWQLLARIITDNYLRYDGFVILHGTDTMAYTASMLSFLLDGLSKPIILTGSQLPIDRVRSDAKENLINALEIAAHSEFILPEVAICFDSKVLRGNRTLKYSSEKFYAFISPNYPPLAEAGVHLEFYTESWLPSPVSSPVPTPPKQIDSSVGLLKFFPGIHPEMIRAVLESDKMRGVVIETYGTGNLPEFTWLIRLLEKRIKEGLTVLNISQCLAGNVEQGRYAGSKLLQDIGVISGHDMTAEASVTKLMYLLSLYSDPGVIAEQLGENLRGEMREPGHRTYVGAIRE